MEGNSNTISTLLNDAKRLALMYFDNACYTLAEKLAMILSAIALFIIGVLLGMALIIFLAIGVVGLLETVIPPAWSFIIVAGLMALLLVLLFLFREPLIVNPVSRYITRMLLNPPKK